MLASIAPKKIASLHDDGQQGPSALSTNSRTIAAWAIAYTTCLVMIIYGPVGWSMMGLIEEWDIFQLFNKLGVFYAITDASNPIFAQRIRPLIVLPYAIGYHFGSNAFVALHVLQGTSLVLKGVAAAVMINWLSANRLIALLCGLIFVVYPADTMQMTLRAVHINCALALSVCGVALFMDATRRKVRLIGWLQSIFAAMLFLTGNLIYEIGLFLAPLPLLLWWARYGWSAGLVSLKAHIGLVVIWGLAIFLAAAYILIVSASGPSYETEVVGDHHNVARNVLARIPLLFRISLYRLFAHGWYDGFRMLLAHLRFWPWLIGASVLVASLFLIFKVPSREPPEELRATRIILGGIIVAVLGYLPYLTSLAHVGTSQRTYLYAALGATISIAGLMVSLARTSPDLGAIPGAFCLLCGLGSQWEQMIHYTFLSHRQRMILAGVLEAAPNAALPTSKRLLIVDRSGATNNAWMLRGWELGKALTWFYGSEVFPLVCTVPPAGPLLNTFQTTASGQPEKCVETASGWDFAGPPSQPIHFAKSDLQLLTIEPDGRVTVAPSNVTQPSSSTAARWQKMLGCWPAIACRVELPDPTRATFQADFGKYWGLDDAPWGAGWRDEEWNLPSRNPRSWSWIISPTANLWFQIKPQDGRYILEVRVYSAISQTAQDSLSVSLNGRDLQAHWSDGQTLMARFDSSILTPGPNELRLSATQDSQTGLSVAIDQVSIRPVALN